MIPAEQTAHEDLANERDNPNGQDLTRGNTARVRER